MRYILAEPIIHTVSDDELTDEKAILSVLKNLKDMNHSVFMEFDDTQNPDHRICLDSVRIIAVNENSIDIHAFFQSATLKQKNIPILSIRKVRLLASKQALTKKYKVSRWHLMDVAEIEGV